jgi:hypothetical protein
MSPTFRAAGGFMMQHMPCGAQAMAKAPGAESRRTMGEDEQGSVCQRRDRHPVAGAIERDVVDEHPAPVADPDRGGLRSSFTPCVM